MAQLENKTYNHGKKFASHSPDYAEVVTCVKPIAAYLTELYYVVLSIHVLVRTGHYVPKFQITIKSVSQVIGNLTGTSSKRRILLLSVRPRLKRAVRMPEIYSYDRPKSSGTLNNL